MLFQGDSNHAESGFTKGVFCPYILTFLICKNKILQVLICQVLYTIQQLHLN